VIVAFARDPQFEHGKAKFCRPRSVHAYSNACVAGRPMVMQVAAERMRVEVFRRECVPRIQSLLIVPASTIVSVP
jgi:hypothetical protein